MKYISKITVCTLAVFLLTTSCNDLLDFQPETAPSDAVMWTSAGAFEKEANNYYTQLPKFQNSSSIYGVTTRDFMSDMVIDRDVVNSTSNSTYGTTETDEYYEAYFRNIRSINYLFKNAEKYSNQDEIKQYIAESHFFRAYNSYRVFVDYGPLTIVKGVVETSSPELYAPRASRDEFANFIIEDLETAINSKALPIQSAIENGAMNGRITLGAAQALLARFCLFEGTWQKYHNNNTSRANELLTKAVQYAELVMNDNSYQLFRDERMGVESYRYMFILESVTKCNFWGITKESNKEYIFRNRFHEVTRISGQNNTHQIGRRMLITRKMVETFLDKDGKITKPDYKTSLSSFINNRDPRIATTAAPIGVLFWSYEPGSLFTRDHADSLRMNFRYWEGAGFFCGKFAGLRPATVTADGFDVPIIRLAEIYLIFAEAKCELGNGSISQSDLDKTINKLRERVDMPHLTLSSVPAGSSMLEEIRRERTVELFLEGQRYDDLRRWKTAEVEMSKDLEGVWMGEGSAFAKDWIFEDATLNKTYTYLSSDNKAFPVNAEGYSVKEGSNGRKFLEKHYLRPLPTKQIELSKLQGQGMEQNPGW